MKLKLTLLFLMSLLALSCSNVPVISNLGIGSGSNFKLRSFQEEVLPNGLHVLWIPDQSLPRVSLNMMVLVGSIDESSSLKGLNYLTAGTINQGTTKKSAVELADEWDYLGAEFSASPGQDFTNLSASGLSTNKSQILSLFAEVLLTPAFQAKEVERQRSIALASIQKQQDQPSAYADELLDREVHGKHPYSFPPIGEKKTVSQLERSDLMRHYFAFYRPNNSMLAVVGQFDESFRKEVRAAFNNWSRSEIKRESRPVSEFKPSNLALAEKSGLQQTQIRMGHPGIARSSPDFLTFRLANVILGGAFASRLNQKIRDDLGLTYSIGSSSDARLEKGSFEVSTFTRHEKTYETIKETQKLIEEFVKNGITDQELDAAKALMVGQFPAAVETPDRLAYNLLVLRRYGISDDYLKNFQRSVQAIKKEEVNASIRRNLHPENLQVVVYSDAKAVRPQLEKLGKIVSLKN